MPAAPATALIAGCAILGAVAGLCAPTAAYRLSVDRGAPPRSACARCGDRLPAGLAGWVRLGDRCPACRARWGPSARWTVPAGAVACAVPTWTLISVDEVSVPVLAAFLLVGITGVLLAGIDLGCLRLPDLLVGPLFAGTLALLGAAAGMAGSGATAHGLVRAVGAAAALAGGYLVLAMTSGGHLGMGDVKLSAVLGLLLGWLGWDAVLLGAALPHLINGPVAAALLLAGRAGRRTALPLGPALMAGALLAVAAHPLLPA
jgi:leader peptidase (prepilin peptidase)/N-methyltransferase